MAKNKKIINDPNKNKETHIVSIRLDTKTLQIYNEVIKRINMSKWFRLQLMTHFCQQNLTYEQKLRIKREEISQAAMKEKEICDKAKDEYLMEVAAINRKYGDNIEIKVDSKDLDSIFNNLQEDQR